MAVAGERGAGGGYDARAPDRRPDERLLPGLPLRVPGAGHRHVRDRRRRRAPPPPRAAEESREPAAQQPRGVQGGQGVRHGHRAVGRRRVPVRVGVGRLRLGHRLAGEAVAGAADGRRPRQLLRRPRAVLPPRPGRAGREARGPLPWRRRLPRQRRRPLRREEFCITVALELISQKSDLS